MKLTPPPRVALFVRMLGKKKIRNHDEGSGQGKRSSKTRIKQLVPPCVLLAILTWFVLNAVKVLGSVVVERWSLLVHKIGRKDVIECRLDQNQAGIQHYER